MDFLFSKHFRKEQDLSAETNRLKGEYSSGMVGSMKNQVKFVCSYEAPRTDFDFENPSLTKRKAFTSKLNCTFYVRYALNVNTGYFTLIDYDEFHTHPCTRELIEKYVQFKTPGAKSKEKYPLHKVLLKDEKQWHMHR